MVMCGWVDVWMDGWLDGWMMVLSMIMMMTTIMMMMIMMMMMMMMIMMIDGTDTRRSNNIASPAARIRSYDRMPFDGRVWYYGV